MARLRTHVKGHWSHSRDGKRIWVKSHTLHPNATIHRRHERAERRDIRLLKEGKLGRLAPGVALRTTKVHPGYSHEFSPEHNYRLGRAAGKTPGEIVKELNVLYVINHKRNPSVARAYEAAVRYAQSQEPGRSHHPFHPGKYSDGMR